ncbi:MAG: hypothetical protein JWN55_605 [Frankiales bacterium]|nr:hypothetical protein [Frankiales bacterium]
MKRTAVRLLTTALVAGSATVGFLPLTASAATSSLTATTEGWYQRDPSCGQASGCLLAGVPSEVSGTVVTNPYPAGTLHVGYTGGQETARSVLAFALDSVGPLTGAVLEVPLDVDPANGDAQSSTAKVQVCLVTGDITPAAGSVAAPPATSCGQRATMRYVATPKPHLTADLAPILLGLPTTSGIALVPDGSAAGDTDAWHVTFSAHDRAGATTGPATLTLTTADAGTVTQEPQLPPVAEAPSVPVDGGLAALPDTGGFVQGPTADVPVASAPVTSPELSAPVTAGIVPTAQTVTVGYAYPGVWLLPLAFLVLVPLASRALTKELGPA